MKNGFLLIKSLIDYVLTIYFSQNLVLNIKIANKKKTLRKFLKSDNRFEISAKN